MAKNILTEKVWEVISILGILELCHPFCKLNPVENWEGNKYVDHIIYYKGIFVAGPEVGLCYGYNDSDNIEKREIYGFTNWGSAFHRTYSWARFKKHVEAFGEAEDFAYLIHESKNA
ncbi:hypothetical protein ACFLS9_06395 [Bacteroidota bacterium]